jgi:hypothetical protein
VFVSSLNAPHSRQDHLSAVALYKALRHGVPLTGDTGDTGNVANGLTNFNISEP